jgi:hypothetical protein
MRARGTALVPGALSDLSRMSPLVDGGDAGDARGHNERTMTSAGDRLVAGSNPVAPIQLVVLARQVLGPLLGEFALEQSRGLADLDQVAVGVPHVAADLSTAIDRRRHELGPS